MPLVSQTTQLPIRNRRLIVMPVTPRRDHPVVDPDGRAVGVERLHDVQRAGAVRRACLNRAERPDHTAASVAVRGGGGHCRARNLFPRKVSFLPGMRYYAGNWTPRYGASSVCGGEDRQRVVAISSMPAAQLEKFYGSKEAAQIPMYMGYAFRAFNTHGRALFTLAHA